MSSLRWLHNSNAASKHLADGIKPSAAHSAGRPSRGERCGSQHRSGSRRDREPIRRSTWCLIPRERFFPFPTTAERSLSGPVTDKSSSFAMEMRFSLSPFPTLPSFIHPLPPSFTSSLSTAHWLELVDNPEYVPDPTIVSHYTEKGLLNLFELAGYEVETGQMGWEIEGQKERIWLKGSVKC